MQLEAYPLLLLRRLQSKLVCSSKHHRKQCKTSLDEEQSKLVCSRTNGGQELNDSMK